MCAREKEKMKREEINVNRALDGRVCARERLKN
jgi:hypothetical protein